MGKPKKAGRPVGETLGGILVGFDQQIMRTTPPAQELVQQAAPIRGLSGEDGTHVTITWPEDRPSGSYQESPMPTTAELMDERPGEFDVCELPLRQYGGVAAFEGRVRTVRCFEDNVLLRRILETTGDGQVLVVDGGGSLRTALLGDMIGALAVSNGWRGIVIHGCVRDVEALGQLPIGIRAIGSNPRKSAKDGTGEVDVPVTFGAATFVPGAWLTCDADGVVVTREPVPA